MIRRVRRLFAVGVLSAALFAVGVSSAGAVSADIDPVAFQKLGCPVNDIACLNARLSGLPATVPYCHGTDCTSNPVSEAYYFGSPYTVPPVASDPGVVVVVVPTPSGTIMPALGR